MTKRLYLTTRDKVSMLERQDFRCAICAEQFGDWSIEFDHSTPVALGNGEKPDQALCKPCHAVKTKRDVANIAKSRRLHRTFVLGEKKAKRPIRSRGFDKRWSRRLDGSVVPREGAQT